MNELLLRDMNDLNLLNKDVIDQHDIGYCSMASIVSNGDSSMFSVESEETCSSRFSYNNCDYTYEPKNTITKLRLCRKKKRDRQKRPPIPLRQKQSFTSGSDENIYVAALQSVPIMRQ